MIHELAADIAKRIPELARDGLLNNIQTIEGILRAALEKPPSAEAKPPVPITEPAGEWATD